MTRRWIRRPICPPRRNAWPTLNAALARKKITFAPGSAEIESDARDTMEALADELRRCPDIPMEIAGHTDAQGGEGSNLALSQARAEAVLLGPQGRRVLVGSLTAKGYGEIAPHRRQRHRGGPRGEPPDRIHADRRGRDAHSQPIATA